MNYTQLTIQASESQQDIIISQLSLLGATGFEQKEDSVLAYFEETAFPSYEVNEALKEWHFEINTVQEQNWNEVWESAFEPVVIDDFCAVRAHFHEPIPSVTHEILITPKMSFGTGHHATTFMMISQMREIDFSNKTVFDFGTGTGILAILAEKLGANRIIAIDNDEWSYENASENKSKNSCTNIEFALSSTLPEQKSFDIVLANINRNVILEYLNHLKSILKEKGVLLLSGLLLDDKKDIVAACNAVDLKLVAEEERNNWIALRFENL